VRFVANDARRRAPFALQMTPMIDVVFLLLIFFLVSTTQTPPESHLSSALQAERATSSQAADFEPQIIEVGIFEGRAGYRLGDRVARTRAQLLEIIEQLPRDVGVFVKGDGDVPTHWAATALQICRNAGFRKLTYVPVSPIQSQIR